MTGQFRIWFCSVHYLYLRFVEFGKYFKSYQYLKLQTKQPYYFYNRIYPCTFQTCKHSRNTGNMSSKYMYLGNLCTQILQISMPLKIFNIIYFNLCNRQIHLHTGWFRTFLWHIWRLKISKSERYCYWNFGWDLINHSIKVK